MRIGYSYSSPALKSRRVYVSYIIYTIQLRCKQMQNKMRFVRKTISSLKEDTGKNKKEKGGIISWDLTGNI